MQETYKELTKKTLTPNERFNLYYYMGTLCPSIENLRKCLLFIEDTGDLKIREKMGDVFYK